MRKVMVFDVESWGLLGPAFAVGWVVGEIDSEFRTIREGAILLQDPHSLLEYHAVLGRDKVWVEENILSHLLKKKKIRKARSSQEMYSEFWAEWSKARAEGATLWAECGWPVEINFLQECVRLSQARSLSASTESPKDSPYPLHEIATAMEVSGMDPMATYPRKRTELPAHDPLTDSRQSARLLFEALSKAGSS